MANSTIPGLVAVSVPALTDLFGVRQSGDSRDKKLTVTQLLTLIPSGGDVSKVGTPVDNQLGVWTGDGTIEGTTALAFNGSTFTMNLGGGDLRLTGKLELQGSNRPAVLDESSSNTNPTFAPLGNSPTSGLGGQGSSVSLIAFSKPAIEVTSLNAKILQAYETDRTVTAFAGGGQGSATILDSSFNILTTVASPADSVKLPILFQGNDPCTVIYIKNDGANAADVFPGSGDDLGAGVDTAVSVAAGESVSFIATSGSSTWTPFIVDTKGSGGAQISGTPANNQLGVWVNSTDIEGDTNWQIIGTLLRSTLGNGPGMVNLNGINILPRHGDPNTGLQNVGDDRLAMVAGGVAGITLIEASSAVLPTYNTNVGITAFATGGQTSATQLNSGYNVVDTVATTGDSVKFSSLVNVGSLVYLKNNGANALDLFPAGGDDLGLGVGVAISVPAGASVAFLGSVLSSTWTQLIFEAGGGGDVTKVGTPANNQIGVWTGDGTIEGDANFLLTGTQLTLPSGSSAGAPELKIGSGQTGFFTGSATQLRITVDGTERFTITNDIIQGFLAGSGQLHNRVSTATVPTFTPNTNDGDTGIGGPGGDVLSLIAGGVEVARGIEASGTVQLAVPDGSAGKPTYGFITDPDTGFFLSNPATIDIATAGTAHFEFASTAFGGKVAGSPRMLDELASATNPTFAPNKSDTDTGIGWTSSDVLSLIAGAIEGLTIAESGGVITMTFRGDLQAAGGGGAGPMMRNVSASPSVPTLIPNQADPDTGLTRSGIDEVALVAGGLDVIRCGEVGGVETIGFYTTTAIAKQTGVAVTDVAIHAALVALGLIAA